MDCKCKECGMDLDDSVDCYNRCPSKYWRDEYYKLLREYDEYMQIIANKKNRDDV